MEELLFGWEDRCRQEYNDLVEKITKLTVFLERVDNKQVELDPVTVVLLQSQLGAMSAYAGCLWMRIQTKVVVIPGAANEARPADPAV